MNWAIHTKGPTAAADLRASLQSALDSFLGSEKVEAERQGRIAQLKDALDVMPPGGAFNALQAAHAAMASAPAAGISDKDLRQQIAEAAARGIDAACALAIGTVNVTVSGCGRVDECTEARLSVQLDQVDVAGLAVSLSRQPPPEKAIVTEGSVTAPPT